MGRPRPFRPVRSARAKTDRNAMICAAVDAGETHTDVAKRLGLRRQRITQIVNAERDRQAREQYANDHGLAR